MDYYEENQMFGKWLRKQKLNPLAELYAHHLYFNVGGWEAICEWQESSQQSANPTLISSGEIPANVDPSE